MGGDFSPKAVLEGIFAFEDQYLDLTVEGIKLDLVLFGPKKEIDALCQNYQRDLSKHLFVEANEIISMEDSPVKALVEKKNSTIVMGMHFLAQQKIDAFASAGNTGAMLAGGFKIIGSVQGVIRPSLVGLIPKMDGGVNLLLDVGANTDCRADVLAQFARLGSIYAQYVMNIPEPKVGLLSIGEEDGKGNLVVKETNKLLREDTRIHFIGNIEGRDLYAGAQDVTVCDGFVGNIALKQTESFYHILQSKKLDQQDPYFERFNFENYGGATILGLKAPVVIAHGISTPKAIVNMILFSAQIAKAKIPQMIAEVF